MSAPSALVARLRPAAVRRRFRDAELRTCLALSVLTLVIAVLAALQASWIAWFPLAALTIPLLLGSQLLGPRTLPWFVVFVMATLVVGAAREDSLSDAEAAAIGVYFLLGLIILVVSFHRTRLGVGGIRGESMLVDLRDRILNQGGMPALPAGWHAESALASAGGTRFAGDFVVTASPHGERLEVVVVDVSGKGEQAGTRALMLSGAFGGLLGQLPAADFLPAANSYLVRQGWDEGFATAVHFSVDLASGAFEVRTAGHPPALVWRAADGCWETVQGTGPVLGLLDDLDYDCAAGVLAAGDAVLLYTDGMVEGPKVDIEAGIEHLLAAAGEVAAYGFEGSARPLVERIGYRDDDRALVVVSRA